MQTNVFAKNLQVSGESFEQFNCKQHPHTYEHLPIVLITFKGRSIKSCMYSMLWASQKIHDLKMFWEIVCILNNKEGYIPCNDSLIVHGIRIHNKVIGVGGNSSCTSLQILTWLWT